jgi:hypothetical protein
MTACSIAAAGLCHRCRQSAAWMGHDAGVPLADVCGPGGSSRAQVFCHQTAVTEQEARSGAAGLTLDDVRKLITRPQLSCESLSRMADWLAVRLNSP